MKKATSIIIAIIFILGSVSFSFADTGQNTTANAITTESISDTTSINEEIVTNPESETAGIKPQITRKWTVQSVERVGYANVGSKTFYDKKSADSAGEKITVTIKKSYSGKLSGELKVSYATLEAKLGFDYSKTFSVSKSKTTRALKKGETVTTYYQKRDHKYKVVQKGTRTGLEPVYKTLYVYKPAPPKITFEYSK